jgi:hypothetical protein
MSAHEIVKAEVVADYIADRLQILQFPDCEWLLEHLSSVRTENVNLTLGEHTGFQIDAPPRPNGKRFG